MKENQNNKALGVLFNPIVLAASIIKYI